MRKLILTLLSIYSSLSLAETSPLGDVIVCNNKTAFLLEYYAADVSQNNPQNFDGARTYEEALNVLVGRLEKYFPIMARRVRKDLDIFRNNVEYVENADLPGPILDSGIPLKIGCQTKKAIAIDLKDLSRKKSFYIQKKILGPINTGRTSWSNSTNNAGL